MSGINVPEGDDGIKLPQYVEDTISQQQQQSYCIKQVEIPKPGPNDVLVKTIACSVCHTDFHFIRGDWEILQ
ncbi:unnamed protein product [Adineta steineri]|uniref:Uncharacterized protein n=1 Tax=Adineta steineri TaxID=433720 RepID=A0A814DSM7_9BILA|nr:unnamed protein product [Adineta steineri]CAF1036005.1 unnamed protein product [Adineta steineri]CAF3884401.1 unnamed protein product [Adineta steineri]CAF4136372.1 unnamed protein product [Adineta steineri]